ncbi:hypothetical protein BJ322DRAFT_1023831 [Thelephora terrestris]|uniref:Uncharacterized protein n=1 Tax=Thelephora terrestris TaxID=56493 RepID=A0A9P6L3F5_9AGAM|nr:hypothetical protein BJ322DRAFT_1023831 [Thelephora terrestris]
MQDTSKILDLSWKVLLGAIVAWGMQTWDLDVLIHLPSSPCIYKHCGTIWVTPSQHPQGDPIMQDTSKILDLSWKVLLGAIVVWGMWILDPDVLTHLPSSPWRSRPLPKNPETLSPILMSIYKVALWNHLGHLLPNTQEAQSQIMQDTSKILDFSWKVLLGPIVV